MSERDQAASVSRPGKCGGDHTRPTKAVAVVSWPSDRYNTERACTGHLDYLVRLALDSDEPLTITPIPAGEQRV